MKNEYCPRDCKYLVPTEVEQNRIRAEFGETIKHKCTKYNQYLYHFLAEPDLYKCEECYRDTESYEDKLFREISNTENVKVIKINSDFANYLEVKCKREWRWNNIDKSKGYVSEFTGIPIEIDDTIDGCYQLEF